MFRSEKNQNMKRFLVKALMFILCLIGFLIHSYFKIRHFYDQEPITEYANENLDLDNELIKLPAISVCFSGSLFRRPSVDKTVSNQRHSSLYYHSKHRLPPNVALLDDIEPQFDDDFALRRRQMFSSSNYKSNYKKNLNTSPRAANQMISVDHAFGLVSKPRFSIKCDLIKATKQRKLTRFTDTPLSCEQIAQVIESINYEADQKCFTFFSQLQQTEDVEEDDFLVYRSDLNDGDLIQIKIYFEEEILKINQAKVYLLIHSNLEMPNFQKMKTYSLRSSHSYFIYFNQFTYKRENTNQSPCRMYKNEIKKNLSFSLSNFNLQQVPTALMDYQVMLKNHLYKMFFSSSNSTNEQNATKIEDLESQTNKVEIEPKKAQPKSQSDCIDKCHLETNRKYCICLPTGVNVRRELLSANDLFCDELRCVQEDLPSTTSTSSMNNIKNSNLKKDQISNNEQLERLYTLSNGQFVSKRYERFKKCLMKNNCIASCEDETYDYSADEKADLNAIVQNILNSLPSSNLTRQSNLKKYARNYRPDGYYYDPNYLQTKQQTTNSPPKTVLETENKRYFSFNHNQPEIQSRTKLATSNSTSGTKLSAFDDLSKNFYKNSSSSINDTKLNASIIVQTGKRNQSSFTTSSIIRRYTVTDQLQTSAISDQLKGTTTPFRSTESVNNNDELVTSSIDPDSVDDNLDNEDNINKDLNNNDKEFTQPSLNKYTIYSKKSFKFQTSTIASTAKNENTNVSVDEELLEDLPIDENIEERHNPSKQFQSLISIRNNHNANQTFKQRLTYSLFDLLFDLNLIAVLWLSFSVYLVADYLVYFIVFTFWYFVRLTFCLDWWFRRTKKHHRIADSASSTVHLTDQQHRLSKGSVSSQESEGRTFVKSIP